MPETPFPSQHFFVATGFHAPLLWRLQHPKGILPFASGYTWAVMRVTHVAERRARRPETCMMWLMGVWILIDLRRWVRSGSLLVPSEQIEVFKTKLK